MTHTTKYRYLVAPIGAVAMIVLSATCAQLGSGISAADPGSAHLTVNGQPRAIQGAIECLPQVITVGSEINVGYLPDGTTLSSVDIHTDTETLGWLIHGYDNGHASGTKSGNTHTVTGAISHTDGTNGPLTPFELDITCP